MRAGRPLLALVLLALLAQPAAGQVFDDGLVENHRHVELLLIQAREDAGWTVRQTVLFPTVGNETWTSSDFWLPAEARNVQVQVFAEHDPFVDWYVETPHRARAVWDGGNGSATPAAGFRVSFTLPGDLPPFVAAAPTANATVQYFLLPGASPPAGLEFEHWPTRGERDRWIGFTGPLQAGEPVVIGYDRPVEPASASLIAILGGTSLLVLGLGAAWSHRRIGQLPRNDDMNLLDHLRELQVRLLAPLVFFALLSVFFFSFDVALVDIWRGVRLPVPQFSIGESVSARVFQSFAAHLVPEGVQLVVVRPMDAVMAEVLVTVFLAFLVTLPLTSYEIGAFLGPALYPDEKRYVGRVAPVVTGLFAFGCAFAYWLLIPVMLATLYEYADAVGATSLLVVAELVSFATVVTLVFGVAFELPLVMMMLARFGVVQPATFLSKWRHAVVVIFLVAALVTPDPSVVNQVLVATPMLGLYFAGVLLAKAGARKAGLPG